MKINALSALLLLGATGVGAQSPAVATSEICQNVVEAMTDAAFPREAMMKGLSSGDVVVAFTVTADDRVTNVRAIEASNPAFERAAISTVQKMRCKSGGEERHLRIPFSYRLDFGASYAATPEDIPAERLRDVLPQIAELKVTPKHFALKLGEGVRIDTLKVLAYDEQGKLLGRLRQFDRDAQPRHVLTMRGVGIVQGSSPGNGFLELSAPAWSQPNRDGQRPTVRVEISVAE